MKAIDALTREKKIIMIAHRLKTVRNADQIFVMDHGKIVQEVCGIKRAGGWLETVRAAGNGPRGFPVLCITPLSGCSERGRKMKKITAVGIGTSGDVLPLAVLGRELALRGMDYCLASFENFRSAAEKNGISFFHLDGAEEELSRLLVSEYRTSSDFFDNYAVFYQEYPGLYRQMEEAVRGSDLVIYGTCSLFARSVCDKYGIPCVRVFFSPFDRTRRYSLYTEKTDSFITEFTSSFSDLGMSILTHRLFNSWRKENGLAPWHLWDDDRKQSGRWIPTFYPVSPVMMPRDPKWGDHIHVTGYWLHPKEDTCQNKELEEFLGASSDVIFVTLGNDRSPEKDEMRRRMAGALHSMHIRAVMQAPPSADTVYGDDHRGIYFVERVPFGWIFPRVRAVISHGGCSTVGTALYAGVPQFVIPLALDQWFYGRRVYELGLGPAPLYIRKKLCTQDELTASLQDLLSGKYTEKAERTAALVRREDGCREAADEMLAFLQQKGL